MMASLLVIISWILGLTSLAYARECPFPEWCFEFSDTAKTYNNAASYCKNNGGTLALPQNSAINSYLASRLTTAGHPGRHWIGLNDKAMEGIFKWEDGSSLGTYVKFGHNEGTNGNNLWFLTEDCVTIDQAGTWHDYNCLIPQKEFICQYKRTSPATTAKPPTPSSTPDDLECDDGEEEL